MRKPQGKRPPQFFERSLAVIVAAGGSLNAQAVRGPIRLADLAERVGVSESALFGMIDVLVSKGRLSPAAAFGDGEAVACSGGVCGSSCVGLDQCAFIANVPSTYTLVVDNLGGGVRDMTELQKALENGDVEVLLAFGPGLMGPVDDEPPVLDPDALAKAGSIVLLDAFPSVLSEAARVVLPTTSFAESEGTFVNFAGRVQHSARALVPNEECRPAFVLLGDLITGLTDEPAPGRAEVQRMLSLEIPELAQIDWASLPASTGQDLAGVDASAHACRLTGAVETMLGNGWETVPVSPRGKPPWIW